METIAVFAISLVVLAVAVSGPMHGGNFPGSRILSNVCMGVGILVAGVTLHGWILGVIGATIALLAFATGHGNFYAMQGARDGQLNGDGEPSEPEKIERLGVRWIWQRVFRKSIFVPSYSYWCMGVKWTALGLILMPYGALIGVIAPIAYALSFRKTNDSLLAEYVTTIYVAIIVSWALFAHPQLLAERLGAEPEASPTFSYGALTIPALKWQDVDRGLHAA